MKNKQAKFYLTRNQDPKVTHSAHPRGAFLGRPEDGYIGSPGMSLLGPVWTDVFCMSCRRLFRTSWGRLISDVQGTPLLGPGQMDVVCTSHGRPEEIQCPLGTLAYVIHYMTAYTIICYYVSCRERRNLPSSLCCMFIITPFIPTTTQSFHPCVYSFYVYMPNRSENL